MLNGLARLHESRQVALHFFDGHILTIKFLFDRLKVAGIYFVCLGDRILLVVELRDSLFNSLETSQVLPELVLQALQTAFVTLEVFQGR